MAKPKKRQRRKAAPDRVKGLVALQQRAVGRWADYAVNAARHVSRGTMSPGTWMNEYASLSKGMAEDLGELLRLVFPRDR